MKEVELKARLTEPEVVVKKLEALGCVFSSPVTQDDTIFVKKLGSVETYLTNTDYLRLRVEGDGTTIFTLKHHAGRADDPYDAPIEHETVIEDKDEVTSMLKLLGFSEAVRIRKTRRKAHYGAWEICIDEVDGLGSFIELEEMVPEDTDVPGVMSSMDQFVATLSIGKAEIGVARYDSLILSKGKL